MKIPPLIQQGVRFGLVGLLNTAITFGVFVLFYRVFRTGETFANTTGYIVGVINSFVWNKFWTFKSGDKSRRGLLREGVLFLVVFAVSFGVQLLLFRFLLSRQLVAELAELFAMVVYTILSFTGNKLLTFRKTVV